MEKIKWIANDEQIQKIYPNYLRYRNYDVNDVVLIEEVVITFQLSKGLNPKCPLLHNTTIISLLVCHRLYAALKIQKRILKLLITGLIVSGKNA